MSKPNWALGEVIARFACAWGPAVATPTATTTASTSARTGERRLTEPPGCGHVTRRRRRGNMTALAADCGTEGETIDHETGAGGSPGGGRGDTWRLGGVRRLAASGRREGGKPGCARQGDGQ